MAAAQPADLWGLVPDAVLTGAPIPVPVRPSGLSNTFLTVLVAIVIVFVVVGFLIMFTPAIRF